MKKITCFVLVLLMLLGMASCDWKKNDTIEIAGISEASKITSIVTYVDGNGTLTNEYVTEIDHENQRAIFTYATQRYATFEEASDTRIVTENGTIHYNVGSMEMTPDGGETWVTTDDISLSFNLKLRPEQFKTYESYDDGNSAVATLAPSQTLSVLGTEIQTKDNSDINVSIVSNGTYVYNVDFDYTAVSGAKVLVKTTYNYEKITLDFSGLENAN